MPLAEARANRFKIDWSGYKPPKPTFLGTRSVQELQSGRAGALHRLDAVLPDLGAGGPLSRILEDNGRARRPGSCSTMRRRCSKRMVAEKWLTANAVVGFWPANAVGDDIELYTDESAHGRAGDAAHAAPADGASATATANIALADFVAPKDSGVADYIGAFAVTAGIGEDEIARATSTSNDDYWPIMVKALADRLAEAFAERMHERVRREFWGYAPGREARQRGADRARSIAASAPRPAIPRSPTTPRRRRSSRCSMRRARPASS